MDTYLLLKFAHILGFILLGGGLLAVWVSEFQAYRTNEMGVFAQSARYTAIFYDFLVIPGAMTTATSGFFLVQKLELGFFEEPWLITMWGLFLFEFVEGNTITRFQFRKTLYSSKKSTRSWQNPDPRSARRCPHPDQPDRSLPRFANDHSHYLLRHSTPRQLDNHFDCHRHGACSNRTAGNLRAAPKGVWRHSILE